MKSNLKKISNSIYDIQGNIKSFKKQMYEYEHNLLENGVELIVLENSTCLKYANIGNYPIVITQGTVKKLTTGKHKYLDNYIIKNLDNEIKNSVLTMDSLTQPNSKVIILNKFDLKGNPIIAILKLNKSNAKIKIHEIASVYDKKEFQNFLNNTINANKNIYTNEKTKHWLLRSGLQLPTRFTNNLVSEKSVTH